MRRSELREKTFIILFQKEFNTEFEENIDYYLTREDLEGNHAAYVKKTLKGILENLAAIDAVICKYLINWSFDRINKSDLAVLRLAIYEMLYSDDVPEKVAINEAIELAKKYNGETAGVFVNGLLDKVFKNEKK